MKKNVVLIFALVCIMVLLAGCMISESAASETTSLTEAEMAYFNGDSFFNGDYLNIRNQFLGSLYDKPEEINLFQLFYCGSGITEAITDEELMAVMEKLEMNISLEDLPCPCEKVSWSNMEEILTKHMNITLADTKEIGLEHFVFLPQYEAYYYFHGDTNYRGNISFSGGNREGDIILLYYSDEFFGDGDKVLTLQEKNGTYLFVANQMIGAENLID